MPNNPVQIILNDKDFHQAPDPGSPPRNKDFFDGRDSAFAAHKAALLAAIDETTKEIESSGYGPAAYLRVQMRAEALAKSYRPVGWVFKPDQFPCVGADAVGTLYFRAPLIYMRALRERVERAELKVEIKRRKIDDEPYKAPTPARAEVGAIESIEIAPPEDKRTFSTAAAMSMLADPRTVSGYQIELFETPVERVIADDPSGRGALRRSLEEVVLSFGNGTRAYFAAMIGRTPVLEMQLTTAPRPALIDNRIGALRRDVGSDTTPVQIDRTAARHEAALVALQQHPLVRAIRPPVQLQLTDNPKTADNVAQQSAALAVPTPQLDGRYPIVGVIDSGIATILDDWVVDRFDYLSASDYDTSHGTNVAGLIAVSQLVNPPALTPEPNGCMLYDAPLYPKGHFSRSIRPGFPTFWRSLSKPSARPNRTTACASSTYR